MGKLRHDANLRWLYQGEQKARGRKRRYGGKVDFSQLSRFEFVGKLDGQFVYSAVVNSVHFKRDLRLVYLVKRTGQKVQTALLFSTELSLDAQTLVRYYKARFQIEFRDAKQFLGLTHCQARDSQALHFHFNAVMTTLNLLQLENRQTLLGQGFSLARWKIRKINAHLFERFSSYLGLDFNRLKSRPDFEQLCSYGAITIAEAR